MFEMLSVYVKLHIECSKIILILFVLLALVHWGPKGGNYGFFLYFCEIFPERA